VFPPACPPIPVAALAFFIASSAGAHAAQRFSVEINGAENGLKARLETVSDLKNTAREYPTLAALRRAARRDEAQFNKALQATGFYAGKATFTIETDKGEVARVLFTIDRGPAFRIEAYDIRYRDARPGRLASLAEAGIADDGSAAGADLQNVQTAFLNRLWATGYPQAAIVSRHVVADFEAGTARAVFIFDSGPKALFGALKIDGLEKTNSAYVETLKPWQSGEQFDRSKMVSYRDRLAGTGLFSTIDIAAGAPGDEGAAPILLKLEERKRRTIGVGASFSTAEGPGGRLFFENRNLFGRAEKLRIEFSGSEIEQSLNFDASKPLPGLPGKVFGNVGFTNETTDAFDARTVSVSGGLAKNWLKGRLETRGAAELETSNIKEDGAEERTYILSTPLSVTWNSEDSLLNPTKGVRAGWTVTPNAGTDFFVQAETYARSRVNFGMEDRFTLAARAKLGATFGESDEGLPLNRRFFAGGGASVRGFGFQEAGPLDAEGDPVGGRSLIEGAMEARAKIFDKFQLAAFVDAGSVSESKLPDIDDEFFIGYGGGLRYFTAIGPIRVDAAFPVDKRETDRGFQIYIAIGQPF